MEHQLPQLPFAMDALVPHMSKETFEYHYAKHHQAYVTNLNNLIKGTEYENLDLEAVVKKAPAGGIYNNSAQVWNHTFFWNCLSPNGGGAPSGALADAINKRWGSFDEFKKAFQTSAVGNFGSGWTWLVKKADGSVDIVNMGAAGTPLTTGDKALLCIDVWEHAYYIDYRNLRPKFVETFLSNLANWSFAENEGFAYMKSLGNNVSQYTKSGSAPAKALARGETGIGITFLHDLLKETMAGMPVEVLAPCEGTGFEIGSMSIVKGARNLANAKKFYEFALRADIQSLGIKANALQVPSNASAEIPPKAPRPENVKLINYDFAKYGADDVRKRLLKRWDEEIFAAQRK